MNVTMSDGKPVNLGVIDVAKFNNYVKLIRVTCRVIAAIQGRSLKYVHNEPTAEEMQLAEDMWIKEMQRDMRD